MFNTNVWFDKISYFVLFFVFHEKVKIWTEQRFKIRIFFSCSLNTILLSIIFVAGIFNWKDKKSLWLVEICWLLAVAKVDDGDDDDGDVVDNDDDDDVDDNCCTAACCICINW